MKPRTAFDPQRIARLETGAWRAYYERNWLGMARAVLLAHRAEFGMSWPGALLATVAASRAGIAFAPLDRSDTVKARRLLVGYYQHVGRAIRATAEATTLADRELDYWVVHRRLARQRLADPTIVDPDSAADLEPLIDAFAKLHAALFNSTTEAMRPSAIHRALAAKAVDRISGGYSPDVAADWVRVETQLRQTYQAVAAAILPSQGATAAMEAVP